MTHQTAYNEFIADFVERHGNNQATRDEAHEWADKIVSTAKGSWSLCLKYAHNRSLAHDAANDLCVALMVGWDVFFAEPAFELASAVIASEFSA